MNFIRKILFFIVDVYRHKFLIFHLSMTDLKTRFAGSYLGIFWAFVQPVMTILVLWFVVEIGFRFQATGTTPFILWFIAGIIPFNFFSDGLIQATNSIVDNSFLVKKIVFRVSLLPIIKISSAFCIHLFFILFLYGIFALYGIYPSFHSIQVIYYLFSMIMLLLSISWVTSALVIFFRDLSQLIQTGLQLIFWGTPILWPIELMPEKFRWILKLNPIYYIVQGYRNCFIADRWLWPDLRLTFYFWCLVVVLVLLGIGVFSKLRPHFADVL